MPLRKASVWRHGLAQFGLKGCPLAHFGQTDGWTRRLPKLLRWSHGYFGVEHMSLSTSCTRPEPRRIRPAAPGFTVLAISSDSEDHVTLAEICTCSRWRFLEAQTCRQGVTRIQSDRVAVAVCERDLSDGTWKVVLDELAQMPAAPLLIVASRLADNALWAEVLSMGGYDVLFKPFEPKEVMWSLTSAYRHWQCQTDLSVDLPPPAA